MSDERFDAAVIGGSYAGLSAALQLARARRSVLIIDAGARRNRFARHSHGYLTRDGDDAAKIAAIGREQLLAYPTVSWRDGAVEHAGATEGGFRVGLADGTTHAARRLVLATGVKDELPDLPGLKERWGAHVFHCPYCHGYELERGQIGVLAVSPLSMHHALMLPDWGPTTFFLNGAFEPDAADLALLSKRGVAVEAGPVARLSGEAIDVEMRDGRVIALAGLFVLSRTSVASPLAGALGCAFEDGPQGSFIATDPMKATSVPNVFACGDAARAAGSVALAVADGALAGVSAHRSLMFGAH
jgi:thioredoxin reductase